MTAKLFLVTRSDLSPAKQAIQAAHALQEFNLDHPEVAKDWHKTSNHLAVLSVKNENELRSLLEEA